MLLVSAPGCGPNGCEPRGPYSLRVAHLSGAAAPWKTFFTPWRNIHEAWLCDDPRSPPSGTDEPPICESNWNDGYQVNMEPHREPGWSIAGHEWRRDRVAFFARCPGCDVHPELDPANPPFIAAGIWRTWQGPGESSRIDPIPEGPVALVRRYERGRCSAMASDVAELLRTRMESELRSTLECTRNPYFGCDRALRHATPTESGVPAPLCR